MTKNPLQILTVFILIFISSLSVGESSKSVNGKAEALTILERFTTAIETKDQALFDNLFYDTLIPYTIIEPNQRKGTLQSLSGIAPATSGYFKFRYFSSDTKYQITNSNTKVRTDGEIASIHFDYEEIELDVITRSGEMSLQLIKTIDGLKISSVLLSDTLNNPPSKQKIDKEMSEIKKLIGAYEHSHETKNSAEYFNLYYDNSVPIFAVNPSSRTSKLFTESGIWPYSYLGYFKWFIVADTETIFIDIKDIDIHTDGEMATVHLYNTTHWGDYLNGWGDMIFHLGRSSDGWKILSQVETANSNPISRSEFNANKE
ncbi:MAG: hypothetical protein ACI93R_001696 [Flavobacteriales bacterium]|jgi:hypothetical protein